MPMAVFGHPRGRSHREARSKSSTVGACAVEPISSSGHLLRLKRLSLYAEGLNRDLDLESDPYLYEPEGIISGLQRRGW
jgi:hypothetical protein